MVLIGSKVGAQLDFFENHILKVLNLNILIAEILIGFKKNSGTEIEVNAVRKFRLRHHKKNNIVFVDVQCKNKIIFYEL